MPNQAADEEGTDRCRSQTACVSYRKWGRVIVINVGNKGYFPHENSEVLKHFTKSWWFLVNDQRDAQFFSMYSSLFLTLYMFRAHRTRHQARETVSIQPLVAVTLCRWPCRLQVGSRPADDTATDSYQKLYSHNLSLLMTSTMCSQHVEG